MATSSLHLNRDIILAMKRQHMKERQRQNPTESVLALAQMQNIPRPLLNLADGNTRVQVLGQIHRTEVYDPVTAAMTMVREGADGIAFFTDHVVYQNDYEDLFLVARAMRDVPVMFQNYTLNEYGVMAARVADASGLMFHASILEEKPLRSTVSLAQRWRMTTLVQLSDFHHLPLINTLSPHVICCGDIEGDITDSFALLAEIRPLVPFHSKVMLTNCLNHLDEVEQALHYHVHAVIVAPTLLSGDHARQLQALLAHR